jgi:hypothetical protein
MKIRRLVVAERKSTNSSKQKELKKKEIEAEEIRPK